MNTKLAVAAALALGLSASLGTMAEDTTAAPVVRGGTVVVQAPKFNWGYVTEKDGVLLNEAMRALNADRATKSAMLTLVANNGELTVIGTTTDYAQSQRVVAKLKSLPGTTKVYAFLDSMTSGGSGSE